MVQTLIHALDAAASRSERFTFLDNDLSPHDWTFAQISEESARRAAYFRSLGLKKGDRLALIVPEGEDFVLSFFGALRAGVIPVPMYPPLALGRLDGYVETAKRILENAGARMLLTTKQISPVVWSLISRVDGLEDLILAERVRDESAKLAPDSNPVAIDPEDIAFLQFTSGSTSDPKGVIVTHANLVANAQALMNHGLKVTDGGDIGITWLPLYHDMGLIGFVIAPIVVPTSVVFIPTMSFVKRPGVWMETISKYRGTLSFAPNFAYGLAAKRASSRLLAGLDLSCLRVLGCGAEPINPVTMRNFANAYAPAKLDARTIMPCYGMAEATLAISFEPLDRELTTVRIDREAYESAKVARTYEGNDEAKALDLVACGRTFPGHELGIMNEAGQLLHDGEVGEIVLRGPSVSRGYYRNEEASRALVTNGWLHTGDLGFQMNGDLYISGRKKDLIILNGRNYYPQAFEWEVEQVDGVRKSNVVAFSVRGDSTEELVIVAETKVADRELLAAAVKQHVQTALGVPAREIVLVGPGVLPKTSSGKLQRRKTRDLYLSGDLARQGNRTIGSTATRVTLARHVTMSAFARIRHSIKLPARKLVSAVRRQETR